jgi:hypothetical protein
MPGLALHFDPRPGISPASRLGALLDAGLSLDVLRAEPVTLGLDGWALAAERVADGVAGVRPVFRVADAPGELTARAARDRIAGIALSESQCIATGRASRRPPAPSRCLRAGAASAATC